MIDGATGATITSVAVPSPVGIAFDSANDTVYAAESTTTGGLAAIDAATETLSSTIPTGEDPYAVAVDAASDMVYVSNYGGVAGLSVIDGATGSLVTSLSVGSLPWGIGIEQASDTIYVANRGSDPSLAVIDGATNRIEQTVAAPGSPWAVGVDATSGEVYLANTLAGTVSVVSAASLGGTGGSANATASLSSGVLSFVSPPGNLAFPAITLDGQDQTTAASVAIGVSDGTGSGAGWQLDATSTTFTDGSDSLSASAVTVASAPPVACDQGATCVLAQNAVSYPYVLPAGTAAPTATALFSAAAGTGMGDQTVTPSFSLAVPANAAAGAYSATWTFSLVSGP